MKIKQIFTTLIYLFVGITTFAQIPTDGLQLFYPFNGNTNDLIKVFINEGFTECSKQEFIKG